MQRFHARQLLPQARRDKGAWNVARRRCSISSSDGGCVPDILTVEIRQRHQRRGILTGIERHARRIAIGVDHIAVEGGPYRGRAVQQPVIERMDVPIGIVQPSAPLIQPDRDLGRHIGAGMGQAQAR